MSETSPRRALVANAIECAALGLFLEKGPGDVTFDDIAAESGISRRTLFRYFGSKDEILAAQPIRLLRSSLDRAARRPVEESLVRALLMISSATSPAWPNDELQKLSIAVMVRWPEAWVSALIRLTGNIDRAFAEFAAHRLRLAGEDDSQADVLGAALNATCRRAYAKWAEEGCMHPLRKYLEAAFDSLARAIRPM